MDVNWDKALSLAVCVNWVSIIEIRCSVGNEILRSFLDQNSLIGNPCLVGSMMSLARIGFCDYVISWIKEFICVFCMVQSWRALTNYCGAWSASVVITLEAKNMTENKPFEQVSTFCLEYQLVFLLGFLNLCNSRTLS